MEVNTEYDVDDSVYVYEEIIGNPEPTTLRDYREVSGGGKKDLKQTFSSGSYTATSGVNADSGSVESSAVLTSTSLSATQRSNIGGSFAWSFLAGSQNYLGGNAFTGQYAGVCEGILSTVQTLSLGRSIYSTQSFQASGYFPLALGYALVDFPGQNGFEKQGAFIASAAYKDGSISGNMGAEVMKIPESEYIDPIAYGSDMTAHGDQIAGIVAGAGCLDGFSAQNQFENFNALFGQGAITGAAGIGEDSFVSLDYIEARTDGHETAAFEVDAKANGDKAAIIGAGSGKFGRNIGFVSDPSSFFLFENFDLQGAISGAAAIGDNNKAEADWIGAITDGERTLAIGEDLKAESDGLAAVGAAAGNFYWDQKLRRTLFRSGSYQDLGVQGAVAGAVAAGKDSKAQADYVGGATNGRRTSAWADDPMAKSDGLAAVGAAAGNFYWDQKLRRTLFRSGSYQDLGVQGAVAGAVAAGKDSKAQADYVEGATNGRKTSAWADDPMAKSEGLAAVGAAAGKFRQNLGQSSAPYGYLNNDIEGAITLAVSGGDDSLASADFVGATTSGRRTS
ncbi:MAG: hypothetical protein PHW87_01285, partial [Methanothrix sp.]|nr:hypothetical protein [Methanothrix sp.]